MVAHVETPVNRPEAIEFYLDSKAGHPHSAEEVAARARADATNQALIDFFNRH